jgi:hypothetical protein
VVLLVWIDQKLALEFSNARQAGGRRSGSFMCMDWVPTGAGSSGPLADLGLCREHCERFVQFVWNSSGHCVNSPAMAVFVAVEGGSGVPTADWSVASALENGGRRGNQESSGPISGGATDTAGPRRAAERRGGTHHHHHGRHHGHHPACHGAFLGARGDNQPRPVPLVLS